MSRDYRGIVTCPWCEFRKEITGPTRQDVLDEGRAIADEHNGRAGHRVKPGRQARDGWYRGRPIS